MERRPTVGLPEPYRQGLVVFTTRNCSICRGAKQWLRLRNVPFREVDITYDGDAQNWLTGITGMQIVPQFFIDDEYVMGGFPELKRMFVRPG